MADQNLGKLQIYSVEEMGSESVTCIVRCVGGVVRTGQRFSVNPATNDSTGRPWVLLDWINRYGSLVQFVDPPHNAKVHFTGDGVSQLKEGLTITSTE